MPLECEYKGFTIWAYISSSTHDRWIHAPEDLWGDPWREFSSREVSVDDCKRMIDEEILRRSSKGGEQLSLF